MNMHQKKKKRLHYSEVLIRTDKNVRKKMYAKNIHLFVRKRYQKPWALEVFTNTNGYFVEKDKYYN